MSITEHQLSQRRKYLGSSDMAAILGLSPFQTPIDIWNLKVYGLEKSDKEKPDFIARGNYLERGLIQFAQDKTRKIHPKLDLRIQCNQFRAKGVFGANLDGLAFHYISENGRKRKEFLPIGYEAKTTSMWEGWGEEEETDQVPDYVALQCHHQMYAADLEMVYIPVLLPAFGRLNMRLYKINRDDKVIRQIVKLGIEWWEKYVETKTPPPHSEPPNIEILRNLQREPKKTIDLSDDSKIKNWLAKRETRLAAEKSEKEALAELIELLGDAEGARLPDGSVLTYLKQRGADRIDRKLLKSKYPEIYSEVASKTTFRVPRIKRVEKK